MAFSQSSNRAQNAVSCNLCETETKLSWKCEDCDILMCDRCKMKRHSNLRNADNHKVVDFMQVGVDTEDFNTIKCKEHTSKFCVMFCKTCELLVCTLCIANTHSGHGFVEIGEGRQIQIEKIKKGQSEMKTRIETLTELENKIKEIRKTENKKYAETKKKIQDHNASLKKAVDQYIEKLLDELDQKWESLNDSFENTESRVVSLKKTWTEKDSLIEEILTSIDAEKIFQENKEMEKSWKEPLDTPRLAFTSVPTFVPGEISQDNVGTLQSTSTDITLQVIKEYTTDISFVFKMSPTEDSLWISDENVIQKVQPKENNLEVISSFNTKVYGMALTPTNDLLIVPQSGSVLQKMDISTGQLTNSNYNIDPLVLTTAVHVTNDNKVVVGGWNLKESRGVVIMMDNYGNHQTRYEYDQNNQPLFTYPNSITTTEKRNICVVDMLSSDYTGRVVMLDQGGDILNIYTGHPDINSTDKPFKPVFVVTTPLDNIIVIDLDTDTLHVLNNVGHIITYIQTPNKGINDPYSIAFTTTGKVYIGCTTQKSSNNNAKLYQVKLLGC